MYFITYFQIVNFIQAHRNPTNLQRMVVFYAVVLHIKRNTAGHHRRNFDNGSYNNVPTSHIFDRGFTGHQHLDQFRLINMNGRVYDPQLGRFLSPDPFITSPNNPQNYNRYSYVLNNPMRYTDPSGYTSVMSTLV